MVCSNGESPRIIHRKSIFRFYYWHTVKLDSFWSKNFTRLVSAFKKTPSKARLMWIKYRSSNIFHAIINKSTLKKPRINYSWNIICSWYGAKPSFLVFDLILYTVLWICQKIGLGSLWQTKLSWMNPLFCIFGLTHEISCRSFVNYYWLFCSPEDFTLPSLFSNHIFWAGAVFFITGTEKVS